MQALRQIDSWPCERAVAVVCGRIEAVHGDETVVLGWA